MCTKHTTSDGTSCLLHHIYLPTASDPSHLTIFQLSHSPPHFYKVWHLLIHKYLSNPYLKTSKGKLISYSMLLFTLILRNVVIHVYSYHSKQNSSWCQRNQHHIAHRRGKKSTIYPWIWHEMYLSLSTFLLP